MLLDLPSINKHGFTKDLLYQSEGGGTVVVFASGRDDGRAYVANPGLLLLLLLFLILLLSFLFLFCVFSCLVLFVFCLVLFFLLF